MSARRVRLTPAMFKILVAVGPDEKHGYAIMRDLDDLDGSGMGPGTLYRSIKLLLEAGLLEETEKPTEEDPRRRYYRVTEAGAAAARDEADRLETLVARAKTSLSANPSPAPSAGTG